MEMKYIEENKKLYTKKICIILCALCVCVCVLGLCIYRK